MAQTLSPPDSHITTESGAGRTPGHARIPYLPAIDGLRAVAVVAVLCYHAGAAWLPGGFLGVDVFFVISGYLITSLLAGEWRSNGRISLGRFWQRRARRLLPELFVLVAAALLWTAIFHADELARLREDALAATAYVMNWRLVFSHQSYFDSFGRPSVLRHLWSLAVEEQFYLAWPLVAALTLYLTRRRGALLGIALAGTAGSAVLMAVLYAHNGNDLSRLYYGTDTRASAVLLGSALALCWSPWQRPSDGSNRRMRIGADGLALVALAGLVACFATLGDASATLYRGGFLGVAAITALLLGAAVHPAAIGTRRVLGNRVMRFLGERSYGIYLWHWPLFAFTRPGDDVPIDGIVLAAVRFAATLALADLSYRFVYGPVRSGAFGRAFRTLRAPTNRREWSLRPIAALLGVMLAGGGVFIMGASSSSASTSERLTSFTGIVTAQPASPTPTLTSAAATRSSQATATMTPGTTTTVTGTPDAETPAAAATPTPAPRPIAPLPSLPPAYIAADVLAIGDSVMLGAAQALGIAGTVQVDAAVGRQASSVPALIDAYRAAGPLPPVLVIDIGSNGTFTRSQFDQIVAAAAGVTQIVFVNVNVNRSWESGNNAMLAAATGAYPNTTLVDWKTASDGHDELFVADGVHLTAEGADLYARLIAAAIRPLPPPPTPTPTLTPTLTPTPIPTPTPMPSPDPGGSPSPTVVGTPGPSPSTTPTGTPGGSPSPAASPSTATASSTGTGQGGNATPTPAETPTTTAGSPTPTATTGGG